MCDVIDRGYVLPFKSIPPSAFLPNNKSSFKHHEFVKESILKFLKVRCIRECAEPPTVVNPLPIAEGKKLRLVFQQGFYFFSFDLESGYHHINIFPPHQQYLGFSWSLGAQVKYLVLTVLPFGLASACYLFTKMLRPLVRRWRSIGHYSFVYTDDGISGAKDFITAKASSQIEKRDLRQAGLKANEAKSHWDPLLLGERLGFIINTISMTFQLSQRKIDKLYALINSLINSSTVIESGANSVYDVRFGSCCPIIYSANVFQNRE